MPRGASCQDATRQVAGGCNGGTLTFEALGVGAVLAIGAVAIAILAGTRRQATAGSLANL